MIESVYGIGAEALTRAYPAPGVSGEGGDFGKWLTQQVEALNQQIAAGDMAVRRLALGEGGNLHEVMMRLEAAKLSFELAVQVRNKVLEAYQDVLRMQI